MSRTAFYASVGRRLIRYDIDTQVKTLTEKQSIELPGNVQFVWPHAGGHYLYASTTAAVSHAAMGRSHFICTLAVDRDTGTLRLHGEPLPLAQRAIHLTADRDSRYLLTVSSRPATMAVHHINPDGGVGELAGQSGIIDPGVLPHQVRVSPEGELAVVAARGNPARRGIHDQVTPQSDPGALVVFEYRDGTLGARDVVAPDGGQHFGPRCIDFHPTLPLVFVSLQIQNKLLVMRREGKRILPEPLFERDLLPDPANPPCRYQRGGEVHVHPSGHFAYCVNRSDVPAERQGEKVLVGADNSFVVFALDPASGEPTLLQRIDSMGIEPRSFSLHPDGRMLVAANGETHRVLTADGIREVCANLAVFAVAEDGTLRFVRKYDMPVPMTNYSPDSGNFGNDELYWAGFVEHT